MRLRKKVEGGNGSCTAKPSELRLRACSWPSLPSSLLGGYAATVIRRSGVMPISVKPVYGSHGRTGLRAAEVSELPEGQQDPGHSRRWICRALNLFASMTGCISDVRILHIPETRCWILLSRSNRYLSSLADIYIENAPVCWIVIHDVFMTHSTGGPASRSEC